MSASPNGEVTFKVRRFVPGEDSAPHWEDYRLVLTPGMTVLDGLWQIRETKDPSLAWRASCRMGICGSCGMMINGQPALACNTQVKDLGTSIVAVAPLPNFAIIRDLVPDLASMFEAHRDLKPWLIRDDADEQEHPSGEYWQSPEELERYLQFSYCIKCGCCMAACPTLATDPVYAGPMPLGQAHRYNNDCRDGGFAERREALAASRGPWRCHFAGECSRACPKGVDPARAIQRMKRDLVLDMFRLRRQRCSTGLADKPKEPRRLPDIPDAPPRTV
jgi:succinate dehydrogenase / fumarate reductase iron-sulfur subunit